MFQQKLSVFLLFVLLVLTACDKDKVPQNACDFEEVQIVGKWEITFRASGNISSGAAECCEFLEFEGVESEEICGGTFKSYSSFHETEGTFEIDTELSEIRFLFGESQERVMTIDVDDNALSLTYEEDGNTMEELWRRVE